LYHIRPRTYILIWLIIFAKIQIFQPDVVDNAIAIVNLYDIPEDLRHFHQISDHDHNKKKNKIQYKIIKK